MAELNTLFDLMAWHEQGNTKRGRADAEYGYTVLRQQINRFQKGQIITVQSLSDQG
jgi:hypothetical protein